MLYSEFATKQLQAFQKPGLSGAWFCVVKLDYTHKIPLALLIVKQNLSVTHIFVILHMRRCLFLDYLPMLKRIDERLKQKRISKTQFYADIAITQSSISLWKTGGTNPKIENLEKIANYLDVSLQWLMFGGEKEKAPAQESEGSKLTADEWELIATYRDLNDEGRDDARKQLYIMQQSGIYKNNRIKTIVNLAWWRENNAPVK